MKEYFEGRKAVFDRNDPISEALATFIFLAAGTTNYNNFVTELALQQIITHGDRDLPNYFKGEPKRTVTTDSLMSTVRKTTPGWLEQETMCQLLLRLHLAVRLLDANNPNANQTLIDVLDAEGTNLASSWNLIQEKARLELSTTADMDINFFFRRPENRAAAPNNPRAPARVARRNNPIDEED